MGKRRRGHNPPGTAAWMLLHGYSAFQTLSLCLYLPGICSNPGAGGVRMEALCWQVRHGAEGRGLGRAGLCHGALAEARRGRSSC